MTFARLHPGAGGVCRRRLLPQRVGYDGVGDGHGRVPVRRVDRDDADDPVGHVRADDAGGPAPGRPVGRHREGNRVGKLAVIVRHRDGDVVTAGWFVHAWNRRSGI